MSAHSTAALTPRPPLGPPSPLPPATLFGRNFVLVCLVALCAFSSFYFLLATLPVYVQEGLRGSEAQVGLVMAVFSVTAVLLRPWIGKAADGGGARRFIVAGTLLMCGAGLGYTVARSVGALLVVRMLHGAGWAAFGTAASALVAKLAPPARRGEAMGYYGMFSNVAMATGPAIGEWLAGSTSFVALFVVAAGIAGVASGLSAAIREQPDGNGGAEGGGLLERTAVLPSVVFGLVTVTYGSIIAFLPLYARYRGLHEPALFLTAYAVTLLTMRSFTGRLSDRYGRPAVIIPGLLLATAALVLFTFATTLAAFLLVAVLYGLSLASLQPAMLALVADRAPPGRRGAAMGTFTTAIDLGIAGGAGLGGLVAGAWGYPALYGLAAAVSIAALGVFVAATRAESRREGAGVAGAARAGGGRPVGPILNGR